MKNMRVALPENLSEFRDDQRRLAQEMDIPADLAYQRLVLYLLAEIACELKGFRCP